jgi:hypothetical protein
MTGALPHPCDPTDPPTHSPRNRQHYFIAGLAGAIDEEDEAWESTVDETTQKKYYFRRASGEVRWERPEVRICCRMHASVGPPERACCSRMFAQRPV